MNKTLKICLLVLLLTTGTGYAQKLPGVQQGGVFAPADIKIDGKATEWGDKFQAYNNATEIFYTVANDNENIYLIVQAKYHDIVDKILRGGLTFTINHTIKKNDKEAIAFTYPVLRNADMSNVANLYTRRFNEEKEAKGTAVAVSDLNTLFGANSKNILLVGIKDIPDSSISVYNEEHIKAVGLFDANVNYTYELAIPLKYLNLPNNGTTAFSYHIKLNEPVAMNHALSANAPLPPPIMTTQLVATDFWGEYTLVKK
jgi:hypothetical protein